MQDTVTELDPVLAEIVRRLVAAYEPERVYLFGSQARAEAGGDGDYDLMVIVPDDAPPQKRRSRLAYQVLRGTGHAADVLVYTRTFFDSRNSSLSSITRIPVTRSRFGTCHVPPAFALCPRPSEFPTPSRRRFRPRPSRLAKTRKVNRADPKDVFSRAIPPDNC